MSVSLLSRTRHLGRAARSLNTDATVAVVGLGSMGHGVAQIAAEAGYKVVCVEAKDEFLNKGLSAVESSLNQIAKKSVAKGKKTEEEAFGHVEQTLARMMPSTDIDSVRDADLIIEAILEDMEVKIPFFEHIGKIAKKDAIIASNTSSFSIKELADACGRHSHTLGLHYFNPVQLMKLVEVVKTDTVDPKVYETAVTFVEKTGKTPVTCADTPGFIVNRLLVPYMTAAAAMVARGDATPEAIDTAMRLGAGHPMGPVHLSDYVGCEINLACMKGWISKFPDDPAFQIPEGVDLFEKMVKKNTIGRKTGQGFYKWDGNKVV